MRRYWFAVVQTQEILIIFILSGFTIKIARREVSLLQAGAGWIEAIRCAPCVREVSCLTQ